MHGNRVPGHSLRPGAGLELLNLQIALFGVLVRAGADHFNVKHENGVRRDHITRAVFTIGELGRNHELSLSSDAHAADTLFPAGDHHAAAQGKLNRFAAVEARIKLRSVLEAAGVMNGNPVPILHLIAFANDDLFNLQFTHSFSKTSLS